MFQFYYRNGCHLCETMASQINSHFPRVFEKMQWIDIDENIELIEKYNELVPILKNGNDIICHHFYDQEKITLSLKM